MFRLAIKSLREFLDNYISNLKLSNTPQSLDDYKRKNDYTADMSYARALENAMLKNKQSGLNYGAMSESLAESGLSDSGYRGYLYDKAQENHKDALAAIESDYTEKQGQLVKGYTAYLDKLASEEKALYEKVRQNLIDNEIIDIDTAYRFAIESGLSEKQADAVSRNVYSVSRRRLMNRILEQVATLKLDGAGVKIYASAMGLSDEDSAYVVKKAEELLKHYGELSGEYLDRLDELEKKSDKVTDTFN